MKFKEGMDVVSSHKRSKGLIGTVLGEGRPSAKNPEVTEYHVMFTFRKAHWVEETYLTRARNPGIY